MWPNFLIIGAAKSGTTALYQYLIQHPEVFMTEPKEPHYFAFPGQKLAFRGPGDAETINAKSITDESAYQALYRTARAKAMGEASVSTLYYEGTAERILAVAPKARLIAVLRNPAKRAFSAFSFMRTRLFEPESEFARALAAEPDRIAQNWHHIWHYRRMGRYGEQLQRFYSVFPREQMRTYIFEDFLKEPGPILKDCFEFLGVDPDFVPTDTPAPLISGVPKNKLLSRLLTRDHPVKTVLKKLVPKSLRNRLRKKLSHMSVTRTKMDPAIQAELTQGFSEDIKRLEDLLGRDLAVWRKE